MPRPMAEQNIGRVAHATDLGFTGRFERTTGTVRGQNHVVEFQERVLGRAVLCREHINAFENVQASTGKAFVPQGGDQGCFLDNRAAGPITDGRRLFLRGERYLYCIGEP